MSTETASPTRANFVERFGEDQAAAIEKAARGHANGINSTRVGSDPFRWAIAIAIGYGCMEEGSFREKHGITVPWAELRQWIIDHGDLAHHNGDMDYLALFAGKYNVYVGQPEMSELLSQPAPAPSAAEQVEQAVEAGKAVGHA